MLLKWIERLSGTDHVASKTHKTTRQTSLFKEDAKLLAAKGSGTICFRLERKEAFNLDLIATNALLRLTVNEQGVKLYCIYRGRCILLKEESAEGLGLDNDPECVYWVSFEANTRSVLFGKDNPDVRHASFCYNLPKSDKAPQQYWMNKIAHYRIETPAVAHLFKAFVNGESTFLNTSMCR